MSKFVKILLIVLAALAVLFVAGGWALRRVVEKKLAALDLGEMNVTSGGVRVNLFRHAISFREVRLVTDVRRRDADTTFRSPIQYVDATIDRLTVRGIRLRGIRDGLFHAGTLVVDAPRGAIVTRSVPADTAQMRGSFNVQSIGIQNIELTNAAIDWQQITAADTLEYRLEGLHLNSKTVQWTAGRPLAFDALQGGIRSVEYAFAKGDYILSVNALAWNFADSLLTADSVRLLPRHPKNRFMQQSAAHSDYNEASAQHLTASGVDFAALWSRKTVRVDSLHIASGHFESYKNRQLNYGQKVKPMLHAMIQNIPIPLTINTIKIDSLDAAYEELAASGSAPGRMTLDAIEAVIRGTTNRVVRPDQYVEVYANAKLMNQSSLQATISLPVDPANDRFEVKAVLTTTPFASLNPMVEPLAQVALDAGRIERMDFTMTGSSVTARADMVLRYNGLKIAIIGERNGVRRERRGLSNLVNWAAVKADNPDRQGLRTASETIRRDPYRSAFNYLWKGVSAGATTTAETGAAKRLMGN